MDKNNYIYRMGTAPNTRAVISQKNKVYGYAVGANSFQQLGATSEFGFDESKSLEPVRGIGFGDQVAELVPGVTEPMTLTVNKTLMYTANLFQMMGYKGGVDGLVRSLKHHRWPFDIKQEMVFSELASKDPQGTAATRQAQVQPGTGDFLVPVLCLLTFFEGCWFNQYGVSFTADAAIVSENSGITVTDIVDGFSMYGEFIDTGLAPTSNNGVAGKGYSARFTGGSSAPVFPQL